MAEPNTYKEIKEAVDVGDGVTTVYAGSLRDAEPAGRLTVNINEGISRSLASRGLGHVPYVVADLPTSQGDLVRIFDKTSPLGRVIEPHTLSAKTQMAD